MAPVRSQCESLQLSLMYNVLQSLSGSYVTYPVTALAHERDRRYFSTGFFNLKILLELSESFKSNNRFQVSREQ